MLEPSLVSPGESASSARALDFVTDPGEADPAGGRARRLSQTSRLAARRVSACESGDSGQKGAGNLRDLSIDVRPREPLRVLGRRERDRQEFLA